VIANSNRIAITHLSISLPGIKSIDVLSKEIYDSCGGLLNLDYSLSTNISIEVLQNAFNDVHNQINNTIIITNCCEEKIKDFSNKEISVIKNFITSVLKAVELLKNKLSDSVILLRNIINNDNKSIGIGTVILKRYNDAILNNDEIYACINSLEEQIDSSLINNDYDYLEIASSQNEINVVNSLLSPSKSDNNHESNTCSLGSIGYDNQLKEYDILSFIKTVVCLQRTFIPSSGLSNSLYSQNNFISPYYIPVQSRFWFQPDSNERKAKILFDSDTNHLIINMSGHKVPKYNINYLKLSKPKIYFITGDTIEELNQRLTLLANQLNGTDDLEKLATSYYRNAQLNSHQSFRLVIIGKSIDGLKKECDVIKSTLPCCFEKQIDYKTPKGSFFAYKPLGETGKITFVYPGVGNSYVGIGRDLFNLFPEAINKLTQYTTNLSSCYKVSDIYPRSIKKLSKEEENERFMQFLKNTMDVSECGTSFSVLYSEILRSHFHLEPDMAVGYSMGEASMFASLGVWENPIHISQNLKNSDIFKNKLSGNLESIRKYWASKYSSHVLDHECIWRSYSLLANVEAVKECVSKYEKVYITMINTDRNLVIAGDPGNCKAIIDELKCISIEIDLNLAIHCEPAKNEYQGIVDLHDIPLNPNLNRSIKFFSTSCYQSIPLKQKAVSVSVAKAFCETVDFPKLVNKVYNQGSRIFIEIGPQQTCTSWIAKILKNQDHMALPINIKGMKDITSIINLVTKLYCHKVNINLDILFN
jgi:PfaB family protein